MIKIIKKFVFQSLFAVGVVLHSVAAHGQELNADIYGKWKITALIGGGIGTLSDQQSKKLIEKVILIRKDRFEFNGKVCKQPNYQRSKEDPATHFEREWRADVSDIPFPNPVTIIDTKGCNFLYPIRKGHLMVAEGGGFFEAVRIKEPASRKP